MCESFRSQRDLCVFNGKERLCFGRIVEYLKHNGWVVSNFNSNEEANIVSRWWNSTFTLSWCLPRRGYVQYHNSKRDLESGFNLPAWILSDDGNLCLEWYERGRLIGKFGRKPSHY